jgi:hypothetical protein
MPAVPKVCHPQLPVAIKQKVPWLNISVNYAVIVAVSQRRTQLGNHQSHTLLGDRGRWRPSVQLVVYEVSHATLCTMAQHHHPSTMYAADSSLSAWGGLQNTLQLNDAWVLQL